MAGRESDARVIAQPGEDVVHVSLDVRSAMIRRAAISLLLMPCATNAATSSPRALSGRPVARHPYYAAPATQPPRNFRIGFPARRLARSA